MDAEFPREAREEAVLVYADSIRKRPNPNRASYVRELSFGTGGIRGLLGYGRGRVNHWSLGRVTLALCRILRQRTANPGLVIAYDSRRMSREFAQSTAGIAAGMGIRVHLFREPSPTPILSYAVPRLGADAGIVITASHNPPEYNGYKVYGPKGGQILGREQGALERGIQAIGSLRGLPFCPPRSPAYREYVRVIGPEIRRAYIKELGGAPFLSSPRNPKKSKLRIVYTPLHGTGGAWLPPVLRHYGFHVIMVSEQARPDGDFPTVSYPNPEEREALGMAEALASREGADIFLGTDPDADRLGAGVRRGDGSYLYMSGNQLGSVLCAFLCETLRKNPPPGRGRRPRPKIFKTIVTTDLQKKIAEANGVGVHEVLTGFKYIAEQMGRGGSYVFGGGGILWLPAP